MRIVQICIKNFRGISEAKLQICGHTVFIGDNNSGKSSVLEAIDLVLGPDRLSRIACIDEHDFYAGRYLDAEGQPVPIEIELVVSDLSAEQIRHFKAHHEFWNEESSSLVEGPLIVAVESRSVKEALRVAFRGWYDADDDDFKAETFFCHPPVEGGQHTQFRTPDKRMCGFLLLRALRTGSRALSLERGSLLDIILRIRELRPKMWEQVLQQLRKLAVAEDPSIGVTTVLSTVQGAIREFVPMDWAADPHLRVSDLTREHLRKTLTVFMATGASNGDQPHAAPFQHQGTGTINMLVLALLSMIAEAKQTVIFAMEEPETAIPPSTQKRIIDAVCGKSSQALFTSHSPYVLEEFSPNQILILFRNGAGQLSGKPVIFPRHIRPKSYSSEYRLRFSESLLSRRVLIAEGKTEAAAYSAAARRLSDLDRGRFSSLEALGIAVFNAGTDSQIAHYAAFFRDFGKKVFAVYDKQRDATQKAAIETAVEHSFESPVSDFEDLIIDQTAETGLRRFATELVASAEWPTHLAPYSPAGSSSLTDLKDALKKYFNWSKGAGGAGDLLAQCTLYEMPAFVITTLEAIRQIVYPPISPAAGQENSPAEAE